MSTRRARARRGRSVFIRGFRLRSLRRDGKIVCASARLAHKAATTYPFAMSTISVSELKKKSASQWLKSAGKDDLVITSKGQPVAVLMRIAAASVESTRALVRSVRALQAQSALQQAAAASGAAELSMSDIDAEIAASRRARRRK